MAQKTFNISEICPDLEAKMFEGQDDADEAEQFTTLLVAEQVQKTVIMCLRTMLRGGDPSDWRGLVSGAIQGLAGALNAPLIEQWDDIAAKQLGCEPTHDGQLVDLEAFIAENDDE